MAHNKHFFFVVKTFKSYSFSNFWGFNTVSLTIITPLSMGFSRQEYWSELPSPPPGALPTQVSCLQADSLLTELWGKPILYVISPGFIHLLTKSLTKYILSSLISQSWVNIVLVSMSMSLAFLDSKYKWFLDSKYNVCLSPSDLFHSA